VGVSPARALCQGLSAGFGKPDGRAFGMGDLLDGKVVHVTTGRTGIP